MTALQGRIQALIQVWDGSHASWCCTRGCSAPDGRHATNGAVEKYLTAIGAGWHPRDLATEPCPGECTCDVGLYLTALRAALDGEQAGE